MIDRIKYFFEQYAFGVCTYLGEKLGISSSRIRLYFIYLSFITMASPVIIYLVLAFWINIKKYMRFSRTSIDY
jgi:phage shock protein C